MEYALTRVEEPAVEPVALSELKQHLRIDSGTLAENLSNLVSIQPGAYFTEPVPPGEGGSGINWSILGDAVEVLGCRSLVVVNTGDLGPGVPGGETGTVYVKVQEGMDGTNWTDVAGMEFDPIESEGKSVEMEYAGAARYIRAIASVITATSYFSVTVTIESPYDSIDDQLAGFIETAREDAEEITGRALITQEWEYRLEAWPEENYVALPKPPLQSVEAVIYTDSDGVEHTLSADDYTVDIYSRKGRIVLNPSTSWPTDTLHPNLPICIQFTAGYGDEAADVPRKIRLGVLIRAAEYFQHRLGIVTGTIVNKLKTAENLWRAFRVGA